MFIKILMLVIFFGIMIGVGFYSRKHATNVDGFVLGGRSVGPWLTAFAYGTSYFSAVIFVGYAGQFGWKYGIASTWIGLGNAFIGSLLAWNVLGRRTRVMTQQLNSATMPEFLGKRYGSNALKIGASAIIFIFLIPYTASLYNGLSRLFGMAFNIDYTVCIIMMAVLTGIYVIAGGYMATAINDFIQGIIMIVGIIAVVGAVLKVNGGFMAAYRGLAEIPYEGMTGAFSSFFGPDPLNLLGVVILTSLGTWGLPQMVQKFYAIKSENAISKGTIISTVFAVIVAGGCYFLGGFGRLFSSVIDPAGTGVPAAGYDSVVPTMLEGLSPLLLGVIVILVLSASMSTLSSLVLASSSTLTLDFLKGNIVKDMDEKKQVLTMRLLIVVFILISVVIAIIQYSTTVNFIAQLMGISWGALAGAFLAPFMYGLYMKKATCASAWCSMIFGAGIMVANMLFKGAFPAILQSPINCGAFAMLAGLVIVPVVSLFTPKPDRKLVDFAFEAYERKVVVTVRDSLGDSEKE
ncbi:MAG: sodium:solute symporter [Clostridia bacterium]|nr:sodium:solute symporter [Clostridia bacterium]